MEKAYGASIRGKMHKKNNMPNQDYYFINNCNDYTLAVVCDGLGSKKYSHYASKRLCKLIDKKVKNQLKKGDFNPIDFFTSIKKKYKYKLFPFSYKNADTTCLTLINTKSSILVFKVGDGMIAVDGDDTKIYVEDAKDFVNVTNSFGRSNSNKWLIKIIEKKPDINYRCILCTDGIAEDIYLDKVKGFIDEITNEVNGQNKDNEVLIDMLKNWPNEYSNDDKTIVVVK